MVQDFQEFTNQIILMHCYNERKLESMICPFILEWKSSVVDGNGIEDKSGDGENLRIIY